MARTKIKFKIGEFTLKNVEFEVDADRDEAPRIAAGMQKQLGSMLNITPPPVDIESEVVERTPTFPVLGISDEQKPKPRKRAKSQASSNSDVAPPVKLGHDPTKFGSPLQAWTTKKKALWLLYLAKESQGITALTGNQISTAFNANFQSAGLIQSFNVSRDLRKAKEDEKSAPVGETANGFFLTDEGIKVSQALIAETPKPAG